MNVSLNQQVPATGRSVANCRAEGLQGLNEPEILNRSMS